MGKWQTQMLRRKDKCVTSDNIRSDDNVKANQEVLHAIVSYLSCYFSMIVISSCFVKCIIKINVY